VWQPPRRQRPFAGPGRLNVRGGAGRVRWATTTPAGAAIVNAKGARGKRNSEYASRLPSPGFGRPWRYRLARLRVEGRERVGTARRARVAGPQCTQGIVALLIYQWIKDFETVILSACRTSCAIPAAFGTGAFKGRQVLSTRRDQSFREGGGSRGRGYPVTSGDGRDGLRVPGRRGRIERPQGAGRVWKSGSCGGRGPWRTRSQPGVGGSGLQGARAARPFDSDSRRLRRHGFVAGGKTTDVERARNLLRVATLGLSDGKKRRKPSTPCSTKGLNLRGLGATATWESPLKKWSRLSRLAGRSGYGVRRRGVQQGGAVRADRARGGASRAEIRPVSIPQKKAVAVVIDTDEYSAAVTKRPSRAFALKKPAFRRERIGDPGKRIRPQLRRGGPGRSRTGHGKGKRRSGPGSSRGSWAYVVDAGAWKAGT